MTRGAYNNWLECTTYSVRMMRSLDWRINSSPLTPTKSLIAPWCKVRMFISLIWGSPWIKPSNWTYWRNVMSCTRSSSGNSNQPPTNSRISSWNLCKLLATTGGRQSTMRCSETPTIYKNLQAMQTIWCSLITKLGWIIVFPIRSYYSKSSTRLTSWWTL